MLMKLNFLEYGAKSLFPVVMSFYYRFLASFVRQHEATDARPITERHGPTDEWVGRGCLDWSLEVENESWLYGNGAGVGFQQSSVQLRVLRGGHFWL